MKDFEGRIEVMYEFPLPKKMKMKIFENAIKLIRLRRMNTIKCILHISNDQIEKYH